MKVKNYYKLPKDQLNQDLDKIRQWLFQFEGHEKTPQALHALEVAYQATKKRDDFTNLCIDYLT